ncbi:MAG: hypothetical protein ACOCRK_04165 [bacterium]
MAFNKEPIKCSKSGIAIPSKFNNKKKDWDIVSKEETNYSSNGLYIDSLEVSFNKKPLSTEDILVKEVMVQSRKENSANIYIGDINNQTIVLEPDVTFSLPIYNLKNIYFKKKTSVDLYLDIFARINTI